MRLLPTQFYGHAHHRHASRTLLLLAGGGLSLTLLSAQLPAQTADGRSTNQADQGQSKNESQKETKQQTKPDSKSESKPDSRQDSKQEEKSTTPQTGVINDPSGIGASELPILLLVVQRPAGTPARKDEINSQLSLVLRNTMRESRRYQVILFSAEHPSIRRALLEHAIAASELVEPIKPASLQKLAGILGAHHILMVSSSLDKTGLKTDMRLMEDAGGDTWITPRSEPLHVDAQLGKIRLKNDQLVALTVDTINSYLGISSHLSDSIRFAGGKAPVKIASNSPKTTPNTDGSSENGGDTQPAGNTGNTGNSGTTPDKASGTNAETVPPTGSDTSKPGPNSPSPKPDKKTVPKSDKTPEKTKIARADKSEDKKEDKKTVANGTPSDNKRTTTRPTPQPTQQNSRTQRGSAASIISTDTGAMLLVEPKVVPPVPPTNKQNVEAIADGYRRQGDTANYILYLRQAIDENPQELRLRKKLIDAYQVRQMLDLALAETERAMTLQPNDSDLSRIYARCLATRGDVQGAIKLLREIVAANPKDTMSQVALGDSLLTDSQYLDAYHAFEAAAAADPKSPLPHRRMARVLAIRASSDSALYAECLKQIGEARKLTPPTDTQTYQGDYFDLMLLMEARLKDVLDQINETALGLSRQRPKTELERVASDLNDRADSASNFLDNLPPAAGQSTMHAHYAQAAAQVVQTVGYLRKYLKTGDPQFEGSLRSTRLDALSEISTAHTRLVASRNELEKGRVATGDTTRGN